MVLLHTYDRAVADSEAFYGQIDRANAVYFAGGLCVLPGCAARARAALIC